MSALENALGWFSHQFSESQPQTFQGLKRLMEAILTRMQHTIPARLFALDNSKLQEASQSAALLWITDTMREMMGSGVLSPRQKEVIKVSDSLEHKPSHSTLGYLSNIPNSLGAGLFRIGQSFLTNSLMK